MKRHCNRQRGNTRGRQRSELFGGAGQARLGPQSRPDSTGGRDLGPLRTRTSNAFGKTAAEEQRVLSDPHDVEPGLPHSPDAVIDSAQPLSRVVDAVHALALEAAPKKRTRPALGLAVVLDRSSASIAAAWEDAEQLRVELIDRRPGTGWVPERLAELAVRRHPCALTSHTSPPPRTEVRQPEALVQPRTKVPAWARRASGWGRPATMRPLPWPPGHYSA